MKELDTVVLTRDAPAAGLATGDVGVIVHAWGEGRYEVEFVTGRGVTVAVLTLSEADIRPVRPSEVLHTRQRAG